MAKGAQMDVTDWNSQAKASIHPWLFPPSSGSDWQKVFSQVVHDFGRIDYVYPIAGIGERRWLPHDPNATGFELPDLSVLDVDLKGLFYTVGLAIQQFRKQEPKNGFRGKSEHEYIVEDIRC